MRALTIMIASLAVLLAADLGTKEWALEHLARERSGEKPPVCEPDEAGDLRYQNLPGPTQTLVPGLLDLHYAENCGAAFSILRTAPGWLRMLVFGGTGIVAGVMLTVMFVRGAGSWAFVTGVPLILAGAIGNLSDRVRHGFVVDFIQVDPDLFSYPIMNVADVWLAIGIGLLILDGLKKPRPHDPVPVSEASTP